MGGIAQNTTGPKPRIRMDGIHISNNYTSSTHAIPPELLTEIFLHLYKDASIPRADNTLRNTHKLTFVMLVCRAWKDIVECAPTLWTDIWLGRCPLYIGNKNTRQWLDYIKARFARSGTLLLNLTIMVACVDLANFSQLLLQHISRCKTLALRSPEDETKWAHNSRSNTSSVIHHLLSSPLPALQTITIDEVILTDDLEYERRALELDAPKLRDLTTQSPYIIPVAYTDNLWDLLQVLDTSNIEHFVVNCGIADWPQDVDTVIPVMGNLRELEWYTDIDALFEQPTLRHLLRHCPNITSLSYICYEDSAESLLEDLVAGVVAGPSSEFLHQTQAGIPLLCPELRRLRIVCASFGEVLDLVLLRPTLESELYQSPKPIMDATALIPSEPASLTRSIMHDLPLELLVDIFLHLYKDPSIPRADHYLHNTHKLTFIMLVCKDWKSIVERAPTLWNDVWVGRCPRYIKDDDKGQWQDYLKTRFTRSGTLPLNLTIMVLHVDLADLSQILLQHISRCKTLDFRLLEDERNGAPNLHSNTPSSVHLILSSPLPVLQRITVGDFTLQKEFDTQNGVIELDAPNLRDIFTESPDIIPFVKPQLPHFSAHNSLERLTISADWENVIPNLPRNRLSLPNLKFLSVFDTDHAWNILQAIDISNIEHLVIACGLASWPAEVDTVIPVMSSQISVISLTTAQTLRHYHTSATRSRQKICDNT
ncbi:hypothetical protein FRC01_001483 [Tulasnella sp. 417]|nr:hypothetical protein FRC01_001483 [Tulasnella sp. 417]